MGQNQNQYSRATDSREGPLEAADKGNRSSEHQMTASPAGLILSGSQMKVSRSLFFMTPGTAPPDVSVSRVANLPRISDLSPGAVGVHHPAPWRYDDPLQTLSHSDAINPKAAPDHKLALR